MKCRAVSLRVTNFLLPKPTAVAGYGLHRRLYVCLLTRTISQQPMQLGSPNFTHKMFHDESWKPIYFGVQRSKVKVTSRKNSAGEGRCTLVCAGFF